MSETLKPCPFCGGKAHWPEPEVNMPYVGCTACGACAQDEVRWNTRPTPGEDKPLGIEEVVETLELRVAAREAELEAYNERIQRLEERLLEAEMRAHQWMVAHDSLKAGKPYNFPKPSDLPDTILTLKAENDALREALTFYRDEWKKAEHSLGFAGPDMVPTHRMICDYGEKARAAIEAYEQARASTPPPLGV